MTTINPAVESNRSITTHSENDTVTNTTITAARTLPGPATAVADAPSDSSDQQYDDHDGEDLGVHDDPELTDEERAAIDDAKGDWCDNAP